MEWNGVPNEDDDVDDISGDSNHQPVRLPDPSKLDARNYL
jgi:hypothetical protein